MKRLRAGAAKGEGEAGADQPTGRSEESDMLGDDDEKLRQAAWRWRFNRRWAQEQARQMDPKYGLQVRPQRSLVFYLVAAVARLSFGRSGSCLHGGPTYRTESKDIL